MRSYWILERYDDFGWIAVASSKLECEKIASDSANEEVYACISHDELSDDEMLFRLDIFNAEELRSFEMNHIYINKNFPYKLHVQNEGI